MCIRDRFKAAIDKAGARDGLVVVLGELTPQAARFAAENGIRLYGAPELAKLLQGTRFNGSSRG